MRPIAPAVLLLHHRGIDKVWGLWWFIAWTTAVLSSQVTIPRIDPGSSSASNALEQLGAIGLCIPLALVAVLVRDATTWLTITSPRSGYLMRLANVGLITAIGLLSVMITASLYPDDIRWVRIVSLFALLLAITLLAGAIFGGTWAAFPGPSFIILATVPGLVPWDWNIVYNPSTDMALIAAAVVSQIITFIVSGIHRPRRISRFRDGPSHVKAS